MRGLSIPRSGKSKGALKSHLIQGLESKMLKVAIAAHHRGTRKGNEVVMLPLHDGWITRLKRCPKIAEEAVKKKTGIEVLVEDEIYDLVDL